MSIKNNQISSFIAQAESQSSLNFSELTCLIKIVSCFYEYILFPDSSIISNSKLKDYFINNDLLNQNYIRIVLRDNCKDILDLYKQSKENNMYGLINDEGYIKKFNHIPVIKINFDDLSKKYTARIKKALNNDKVLLNFGIDSKSIKEELLKEFQNEFDRKKYVTRTTFWNLSERNRNYERQIKYFSTAYYWDNIPRLLGVTPSLRKNNDYDINIIFNEVNKYLTDSIKREIKNIQFPSLDGFNALDKKDIKVIRKFQTYKDLRKMLKKYSAIRSEDDVNNMYAAFLNHSEALTGYFIKRKHLPDNKFKLYRFIICNSNKGIFIDLIIGLMSILSTLTSKCPSFPFGPGLFIPKPKEIIYDLQKERKKHIPEETDNEAIERLDKLFIISE